MSKRLRREFNTSRLAVIAANCLGSPPNATCARRSSAHLHTEQRPCGDTGGKIRQNLHLFSDFDSKIWGDESPTRIPQLGSLSREPQWLKWLQASPKQFHQKDGPPVWVANSKRPSQRNPLHISAAPTCQSPTLGRDSFCYLPSCIFYSRRSSFKN